jgi:hypothetical protein
LLPSGAEAEFASWAAAVFLARRLERAPSRYIARANGASPYSRNVKRAPTKLPPDPVASARLIMATTYIQPSTTIHIYQAEVIIG